MIVLIGPADALSVLSDRVDKHATCRSFTDEASTEALEYILQHQPSIVVIEQKFAASSRGAGIVGRIRKEPSLAQCDLRVLAADGTPAPRKKSGTGIKVAAAQAAAPTAAQDKGPAAAPVTPRDEKSTRRAPRVRMTENLSVTVDGNPAVLVDLSSQGAQLLSRVVLRPNQRVRVAFSEEKGGLRCAGAVQWASFEMPNGQAPRYRAGVRFSTGDADALAGFAERHRDNGNGSDRTG